MHDIFQRQHRLNQGIDEIGRFRQQLKEMNQPRRHQRFLPPSPFLSVQNEFWGRPLFQMLQQLRERRKQNEMVSGCARVCVVSVCVVECVVESVCG